MSQETKNKTSIDYRHNKFLIDKANQYINESIYKDYLFLEWKEFPVNTLKEKFTNELINDILENGKISTLDKALLDMIGRILPVSSFTANLMRMLSRRLSSNTNVEATIIEKWKILEDTDFLKTLSLLSKNLSIEELIKKQIITEATKEFGWNIINKLNEELNQFKAEIRGKWLKNVTEKQDNINKLKSQNRQLIKEIFTQLPSKHFCYILKRHLELAHTALRPILSYIFRSKNYYLKRNANIFSRKIKKIEKIIEMKQRNIKINEELELQDFEKAKEKNIIWYPKIMQTINENKEWKNLFDKLPLQLQPAIMRTIANEIHSNNIFKAENEIRNEIENIYQRTTKAISENSMESITGTFDMTKDEEELIGKLLKCDENEGNMLNEAEEFEEEEEENT